MRRAAKLVCGSCSLSGIAYRLGLRRRLTALSPLTPRIDPYDQRWQHDQRADEGEENVYHCDYAK